MENPDSISAFCRDSAADHHVGAPPQGSETRGALYSPQVGPTLRKFLDADKLRRAKFYRPKPMPVIAPIATPVVEAAPEVAPPIEIPAETPQPLMLQEKVRLIKKIVARAFGVSVADMMGESRKDFLVRPRHVAIVFGLDLLELGYSEAGRRFGKDHTSVIHAQRRVRKHLANPDYAARFCRLREEIQSKIEVGQ